MRGQDAAMPGSAVLPDVVAKARARPPSPGCRARMPVHLLRQPRRRPRGEACSGAACGGCAWAACRGIEGLRLVRSGSGRGVAQIVPIGLVAGDAPHSRPSVSAAVEDPTGPGGTSIGPPARGCRRVAVHPRPRRARNQPVGEAARCSAGSRRPSFEPQVDGDETADVTGFPSSNRSDAAKRRRPAPDVRSTKVVTPGIRRPRRSSPPARPNRRSAAPQTSTRRAAMHTLCASSVGRGPRPPLRSAHISPVPRGCRGAHPPEVHAVLLSRVTTSSAASLKQPAAFVRCACGSDTLLRPELAWSG